MSELNAKIAARIKELRKTPKGHLIRSYPSRLDMSHLKQEDKWTIICGHLEAEFGRRALVAYDAARAKK